MLQFPRGGAEAVKDVVLPHAIDPLPARGQDAGHKVPALTLAGAEAADNLERSKVTTFLIRGQSSKGHRSNSLWGAQTDLSLCVHERDGVATVADDKLVARFGQRVDGVDGDVSLTAGDGRFEGVGALCRLQVPELEERGGKNSQRSSSY